MAKGARSDWQITDVVVSLAPPTRFTVRWVTRAHSREMQGKHAPAELPPAPGVVAVVVGWQLLSFQTPPPMNEEWEEGGRETDTTGMAKVTGGGKKGEERGRVKRTAERQPVIEARGVGVAGRLKEEERGRDIVMGHPEEVECQEAISLLSAGVMPLLFHPMLNTC